jgi:hypothetical protein
MTAEFPSVIVRLVHSLSISFSGEERNPRGLCEGMAYKRRMFIES